MKKVSFDFDDTLSYRSVQKYAKELIDKGIDVHITTSRFENSNKYPFTCTHNDLFRVADRLSIPRSNIHFTEYIDKADWFIMNPEYDFVWHLDNDYLEIQGINNSTSIRGIDFTKSNWKELCNKLLNEKT